MPWFPQPHVTYRINKAAGNLDRRILYFLPKRPWVYLYARASLNPDARAPGVCRSKT